MDRPAMRVFKHIDPATIPPRIRALPRDHRGYPVPRFVQRPVGWEEGQPIDFRIMDPDKFATALRAGLCAICGAALGSRKVFLGGPLSTAQRMYADAPTHRECAEFAVRACPFIAIPSASRRDTNLPPDWLKLENLTNTNPEVFGLVVARQTKLGPGALIADQIEEILWYCEGRLATHDEVTKAIAAAAHQPEVVASPNRAHIQELLMRLPVPQKLQP